MKSSFLALITELTATAISNPSLWFSLSLSLLLPPPSHPTRSVCHLCDCFGCPYCFSFLSHVSSCCLLIPQAGAAHLECIILIVPGEGDRLEGQLVGSRGGGVRKERNLVNHPSLYREKRLSVVKKKPATVDDSSPTKQPTTITGPLIPRLTTTRNSPLIGSTPAQY